MPTSLAKTIAVTNRSCPSAIADCVCAHVCDAIGCIGSCARAPVPLHPAVKHDTLVNGGALTMALNALRRAGKHEIADELTATVMPFHATDAGTSEPSMREALELTAQECEEHPLYLGPSVSPEDIDREGGDAAFITVMAHRARQALV